MKENFGCKTCGSCAFTDRRGEKLPIIREFDHRNILLNSVPTYLGDKTRELSANRISARHLLFTVETADEVINVIRAHRSSSPLGGARVRRAGRR
jgi:hypothetical protein